MLLDNLQWAGSDGLELPAFLLHSGTGRVRVIAAYRDTEVQSAHPLTAPPADLAHAGLAGRHTLMPLEREQAACLPDQLLDRTDRAESDERERVLQRAGGVLFYLVGYERALQIRAGSAAVEEVPWSMAQRSIRQRPAVLPVTVQEVVGIASARAPGDAARATFRDFAFPWLWMTIRPLSDFACITDASGIRCFT